MRGLNKLALAALTLIMAMLPALATAQLGHSSDFSAKYKLKQVVVLSRHNIRAPLSTNGSALSKLTPNKWTSWSAAPSELTSRGGIVEAATGIYFRKWLISEGLFTENYVPNADEVYVYANSMQRCIATAQYFVAGFMPVANLTVNHRYVPSKMDPVFFPRLTKASDAFKAEALRQIGEMGGSKGIKGIAENLKPSFDVTARVLDLKDSEAGRAGEKFDDYDTKIYLELGKEPNMSGTLKQANSASDALILQYYEEPDAKKAAFGHDITEADWAKIAKIKDVYGDVLFAAPIVAANCAHPLLQYMYDELNSTGNARKFTFLCGHDSNIASVTGALSVEEYELPDQIEKKTPIGSKLMLEKYEGTDGNTYVAVRLAYLTPNQLRHIAEINDVNPPHVFNIKLKGYTPNADGLYTLADVNRCFEAALRAYDDIK